MQHSMTYLEAKDAYEAKQAQLNEAPEARIIREYEDNVGTLRQCTKSLFTYQQAKARAGYHFVQEEGAVERMEKTKRLIPWIAGVDLALLPLGLFLALFYQSIYWAGFTAMVFWGLIFLCDWLDLTISKRASEILVKNKMGKTSDAKEYFRKRKSLVDDDYQVCDVMLAQAALCRITFAEYAKPMSRILEKAQCINQDLSLVITDLEHKNLQIQLHNYCDMILSDTKVENATLNVLKNYEQQLDRILNIEKRGLVCKSV